MSVATEFPCRIPAADNTLELPGALTLPADAAGLVVFAHGSGSSRLSPRNRHVAAELARVGFATLLFDLLTPEEARERGKVFDIALLAGRVRDAVAWARAETALAGLKTRLFGASTGAAAALCAAAEAPGEVAAVVSRGGRPDLAAGALGRVVAPTLLIVGGADRVVLELNEDALTRLRCPARLQVVPGAGHLFEEAGALDRVVALAADWFGTHLAVR